MDNKLKRLAAYYKPYMGLFWSDMFFAMLGAAVTLIIPLLVRYITGTVVELPIEESTKIIIKIGIIMIAMVALECFCNF